MEVLSSYRDDIYKLIEGITVTSLFLDFPFRPSGTCRLLSAVLVALTFFLNGTHIKWS